MTKKYEYEKSSRKECVNCGKIFDITKFRKYYYTPRPKKGVTFPKESKRLNVCKICTSKKGEKKEEMINSYLEGSEISSKVSDWLEDVREVEEEIISDGDPILKIFKDNDLENLEKNEKEWEDNKERMIFLQPGKRKFRDTFEYNAKNRSEGKDIVSIRFPTEAWLKRDYFKGLVSGKDVYGWKPKEIWVWKLK